MCGEIDGKVREQIDEVRSGGSYMSQSDLRIHFGLGHATKIDLIEVRWPSGQVDTFKELQPNRLIEVKEGVGSVKTIEFTAPKKS
jgi:hypothetical protein